jgi:hypothetical protein
MGDLLVSQKLKKNLPHIIFYTCLFNSKLKVFVSFKKKALEQWPR